MELQVKEEKYEKDKGKFLRKSPRKKRVYWLQTYNHFKIMGQKKAFCRQRIPESSCVRKGTVDKYILKISTNGVTKIMQLIKNNEWTCHKNEEVRPVLFGFFCCNNNDQLNEHLPK